MDLNEFASRVRRRGLLRALAEGVYSRVESPAELAGRTLFFDWVDYVGGLFDGRRVDIQHRADDIEHVLFLLVVLILKRGDGARLAAVRRLRHDCGNEN